MKSEFYKLNLVVLILYENIRDKTGWTCQRWISERGGTILGTLGGKDFLSHRCGLVRDSPSTPRSQNEGWFFFAAPPGSPSPGGHSKVRSGGRAKRGRGARSFEWFWSETWEWGGADRLFCLDKRQRHPPPLTALQTLSRRA